MPSEEILAHHLVLEPVYGCSSIVGFQTHDVFELWGAWEKESNAECPIPFWAVVWPGAVALAHYLLDRKEEVTGRIVLDIGCGGGIAGIAAACAGAKGVISNDIDPVALHICWLNSEANGVSTLRVGRDLTNGSNPVTVDTILVADMFYLRQPARALTAFLRRMHHNGAKVIIADGQRNFAPRDGIKILSEEQIPVNEELEGASVRTVRILSLLA